MWCLQVRTNIYYLFLIDTLLHCYFYGLEGLCNNTRAGLDAAVVLVCWMLQVTLDQQYSVFTSVVIIVRLHRVSAVGFAAKVFSSAVSLCAVGTSSLPRLGLWQR